MMKFYLKNGYELFRRGVFLYIQMPPPFVCNPLTMLIYYNILSRYFKLVTYNQYTVTIE